MRLDPFARPLDALLLRLRVHALAYQPDPLRVDTWRGCCPSCREAGALTLREHGHGGSVALTCGNGCRESRIVAALAEPPAPAHDEHALDLGEQAVAVARRALDMLGDAHKTIAQLSAVISRGMA